MKKFKTKKYATGTGDLGMLLGKSALSTIFNMSTNAIGELGYSINNPEQSPIAIQNPTIPIMKNGGKLRKYLFGGKVKAEVEDDEAYETPDGEVGQFQGDTHAEGGIDIEAPEGTKIYSSQLSKDGKSMADRKLARDREENKLMKMLSKRPGDSISKRTFDRKTQQLERQEALDLQIQELAQLADEVESTMGNKKQMKETFAFGTSKNGIDPFELNISPLDITADNTFGTNKQYTIDNYQPLEQDTTDLNLGQEIKDPIPTPQKEGLDMSFGDSLGLLGNAVGATAPLTTTLLNRFQDRKNPNFFNTYGQAALADNDKLMQNLQANRDVTLRDIDLQSATTGQSINDGARSSSVKRSSQLALNSNTNLAKSKARANYAQQLASVFGQRAQMNLNIDQTRSQGATQADQLDRADTDAFFTNLNKDFNNVSTILQKTGKDFNDRKYNERALTLLNQTGLYGQYFDKDGNLKAGVTNEMISNALNEALKKDESGTLRKQLEGSQESPMSPLLKKLNKITNNFSSGKFKFK